MTYRILPVIISAMILSWDIDTSHTWKPFWLVLDVAFLAFWTILAVRWHRHEVEKARSVRLWRTR